MYMFYSYIIVFLSLRVIDASLVSWRTRTQFCLSSWTTRFKLAIAILVNEHILRVILILIAHAIFHNSYTRNMSIY